MRINCKRHKRSHWGDRNTWTLDCGVTGYDIRNQYLVFVPGSWDMIPKILGVSGVMSGLDGFRKEASKHDQRVVLTSREDRGANSELISIGYWFTQSELCNGCSIKLQMSRLRELPDWWKHQGVERVTCPERGWELSTPPAYLAPMPTWLLLSCTLYHKPVIVSIFLCSLNPSSELSHLRGGCCRKSQSIACQWEVQVTTWDLRLVSDIKTVCGAEPWHLWGLHELLQKFFFSQIHVVFISWLTTVLHPGNTTQTGSHPQPSCTTIGGLQYI